MAVISFAAGVVDTRKKRKQFDPQRRDLRRVHELGGDHAVLRPRDEMVTAATRIGTLARGVPRG
jgi:hypothetical protein